MANSFDIFDNPVASGARDVGTSFAIGSNGILKMAGDFGRLVTGEENVLSKQAKENIEYLQQQKSPELQAAEQEREKAVNAETDPFHQAWAYVRQSVSNPLLFGTTVAETAPSSIGPGALGAGARMAAGKLLARKGAEFATKVGIGTALGTGAAMQGADVGGDQMDELLRILAPMDEKTAMAVPQIADLVQNKGASLPEAKTAVALEIARKTALGAGGISIASQFVPGGQTIEKAIVGRAEKTAAPSIAGRVLGAVKGGLGEATQETLEEGGGQIAKNILARPVEPEREATAGVGPVVGQAIVGAGALGAAHGAAGGVDISRRPEATPRPVQEGETTAGMSGEPPAPAATRTSVTEQPAISLERSEEMTPEQFQAAVNVRQALLSGAEPKPEDVKIAGEVPPPKTLIGREEMRSAIEGMQQAVEDWRARNPNAPDSIRVVYDPEMLHNGYGIQGSYNPKDGSIFINAAFVKPENAGQIASHEWAHSTLATEQGRAALAEFAAREIPKEDLDALARRYGTDDRMRLLEEWIAENQEKAPGVVSRIITRVREWLANLGIVNLSDAEVANVMLRTLRQQAENRTQPSTTEQGASEPAMSLTEQPANLNKISNEPEQPARQGRFNVSPAERGRDFADAIARTAQDHPRGAAVEVKPAEFYTDPANTLFLSEDGLAGAAVKPDGDLVSVFKHPTSKARMKDILDEASRGAVKLDAYDIDGFLPQLYSNFGFKPVARVAFNDEYAPPRWNYGDMGRPDVVLMVKDPANKLGLPDATLYTDKVREQVPLVESYDEAVRLQQDAVDRLKEDRKFSLTEKPVEEKPARDGEERIPQEGDEDFEEEVDTTSRLGTATKRHERDDLPPTSALNTLYAKDSSVPLPVEGKRTNGQVAEQLRQVARDYWGRELDSSNITPEEKERLVNNAVEEVVAGLKASNHAGNWYTTAIRKAMAIASILHPELADDKLAQRAGFKDAHSAEVGLATAMAITSQNLSVLENTKFANEQFKILKETGRFDPSKNYGSKGEAISGNLELANALLDRVGWEGIEGFLNREYTVKELNEIASKVLGREVSISGKVDDVVNGSSIFGPKIGGGFFQNLRGNFNPVTVDLWMRRTWGRWTGDVLPEPLDANRLARLLVGMREAGVQLPEELRSIRTIIAKKGRKVPTLTEETGQRILSDPAAVTAAYDFAGLHDSRWNKIYGEVRQNIMPEQAAAVRDGSLSLEQLNRQQQKSLREKQEAWQALENRPPISSKEGRRAQKELFAKMDAEAGRTAALTNEELSDLKPEWAKAARVIKTLLKPIDVPSDIDRRVIVDVVNRVRTELERRGISATNADIQAILWYPEKDLWAKLAGKPESKLKSSYDEEFLRVAESQGLGKEARIAAAGVRD